MYTLIIILALNLICSWFLILFVYKYLKKERIISSPNKRSLHSIPKLNGGGIAILISYEIFCILLFYTGYISEQLFFSQLSGSIILGSVGWLDDKRGLHPGVRLCTHIAAALILIILFNGFYYVHVFGKLVYIAFLGNIFMLLYITWMINLYNFMDGIDGLALSQLIVPSIFIVLYFFYKGHYEIVSITSIIITSSIFFFRYNWPPSKMFMGDVLSGFLGYFFSLLTLYLNNVLGYSFFIIPVLMALFIYDATITLIIRILNGERIFEAHNSHIYQEFTKVYGHKRVTIGCIIINMVLYIPAIFIIRFPHYDFYITIITYVSMTAMVFVLKRIFLKKDSLVIINNNS